MSAVGVLLILAYFLFVVLVGLGAYRRTQLTAVDYYLANRGLGPWLLMLTYFATVNSSFGLLGIPSLAYVLGGGIFPGLFIGGALAGVFIYLCGYKLFLACRKYGFISLGEALGDRFESPALRQVVLWASLVLILPYMAIQIIGAGHLFAGLTGNAVPYLGGAIIIVLATLFYVYMGGMRGVVITDAAQGLMMLLGVVAMFFLVFSAYGGFAKAGADLVATAPKALERSGMGGLFGWKMSLGWMFLIMINMPGQPQLFQRMIAANSTRTLKFSLWAWPLAWAICAFPVALLGMYGRVLVPGLQQPDQVIPAMMAQYLPSWLAVFLSLGVLAAMMSTFDSQLLSTSSFFGRDLYRPYINRNATTRQEVGFGRSVVVILALLAFVISIRPPGLIGAIAGVAFPLAIPLVIPMLGAFYWKRSTAAGAITAIVAGQLSILLTVFGVIPRAVWMGFDASIYASVVSGVLLILVSLATAKPSDNTIKRYFEDLQAHERRAPAAAAGD